MRDNADNRLRLRTHRWYDPHYQLLEGDSSKYAEGPFYVIRGDIIDGIVRSGLTVRMGGPNEGASFETGSLTAGGVCMRTTLTQSCGIQI